MLLLYQTMLMLLAPLLPIYLRLRVVAGKEDSSRLGERGGRSRMPRPQGRLLWLHAASVGEAVAAMTLARALLTEAKPQAKTTILLTTGTLTSARMVAERKAEFTKDANAIIHQFAPLDTRAAIRRFLDHWQPQLLVLVEGDLWPNMLLETQARGIPIALVSAQLSNRGLAFWGSRLMRKSAARIFSGFKMIRAIDDEHAARFAKLPIDKNIIALAPSLKLTAPPPPPRPEMESAIATAANGRMVIAMLSSHETEEAIFLDALARLEAGRFLGIIAPRHPVRGGKIRTLAATHAGGGDGGSGTVRLASTHGYPDTHDTLWIADSLGDMGGLIRAADIIVLGGGFARLGGHNPMEAAMLGKGVISGRHVFKNKPAFDMLAKHGGVVFADSESDLADHLALLSASPSRIRALNSGAAAAGKSATGDTAQLASRLLALAEAEKAGA